MFSSSPIKIFFNSCLLLALGSCRSYAPVSRLDLFSVNVAPVFVVPVCDHRNAIEKVYFHSGEMKGEEITEVTVLFRDEDQPFFIFDQVYDLYRRFKYHRRKDIETFFLHQESTGKGVQSIDFGDTYSRDQKFRKGLVVHYHEVIGRGRLEMKGERPVIYINTWNHLFSEKDTNPGLEKTVYETYASFSGTRKDAEPGFSK
jgi:hypothetical protein